jgi:outer membrane lipoprotein-sorting protein
MGQLTIIKNVKLVLAAVMICAPLLIVTRARAQNAEAILQKTRDTYAGLKSYSDTGIVLSEYGSSSKDRHTFTTYFTRTPRHFYFEFHKQGGERYVVWGDPDAFHTWGATTGQQYDYPNPNNVPAINQSGYQTTGSITKIPALLYGKEILQGVFTNFVDVELDGTENIDGRKCHRLVGRASDFYGTGKEVNIHRLTVWIDAESFFVREAREESKALPGHISRTTTTFAPQANPSLDESKFRFTAPEQK